MEKTTILNSNDELKLKTKLIFRDNPAFLVKSFEIQGVDLLKMKIQVKKMKCRLYRQITKDLDKTIGT